MQCRRRTIYSNLVAHERPGVHLRNGALITDIRPSVTPSKLARMPERGTSSDSLIDQAGKAGQRPRAPRPMEAFPCEEVHGR